ncbi:MAG: hypothetical protein SGJ20_05085 [Planctomycetota bacterium]|nr:hypothetical protein [Planctomycetota bacterium]
MTDRYRFLVQNTAFRAIACGALALFLAGCGSAAYEEKAKKAVSAAAKSEGYLALAPAATLGDTPVAIRLPNALGSTPLVETSADPDTPGTAIAPNRLRPTSMQQVPGFVFTLESRVENDQKATVPVSCAIWAVEEGKFNKNLVLNSIAAKVKQESPDSGGWQSVTATGPNGETSEWKQMSASGQKDVPVKQVQNGEVKTEKVDEDLEIWVHEPEASDKSKYYVLLAYRAPTSVANKFSISSLAPLAAGTIQIGAGAEK